MQKKLLKTIIVVSSILFVFGLISCDDDLLAPPKAIAPTDLKIEDTFSNYLSLTFTKSPDHEYVLYVGESPDMFDGGVLIYRDEVLSVSNRMEVPYWFFPSNLEPGETYYFGLEATCYINEQSSTTHSKVIAHTIKQKNLDPPTEVTAKKASGNNYITVTWTGTGAYAYSIYYDTNQDLEKKEIVTKNSKQYVNNSGDDPFGEKSIEIPMNIDSDKSYYFWVQPNNSKNKNISDPLSEPVLAE